MSFSIVRNTIKILIFNDILAFALAGDLMDIPQNDVEGYKKTSVIEAAKNLHGKFLIVHGAIDDNVHPENTFKLIHALQQADREFELMMYPSSRHGIGGMHYRRLMVDFMKRVLKLDPPVPSTE